MSENSSSDDTFALTAEQEQAALDLLGSLIKPGTEREFLDDLSEACREVDWKQRYNSEQLTVKQRRKVLQQAAKALRVLLKEKPQGRLQVLDILNDDTHRTTDSWLKEWRRNKRLKEERRETFERMKHLRQELLEAAAAEHDKKGPKSELQERLTDRVMRVFEKHTRRRAGRSGALDKKNGRRREAGTFRELIREVSRFVDLDPVGDGIIRKVLRYRAEREKKPEQLGLVGRVLDTNPDLDRPRVVGLVRVPPPDLEAITRTDE